MADLNARLYARTYGRSSSTGTSARSGQSSADSCAPACADCGMLECLCRPRFFAGQLLTEQDLNRLDAYIRAKNRLHTLQLNGWGAVNGLGVTCDPCSTGVIVGTGYAISPCGEDIIVCSDTTVDICALIKKCRTADVTCQPASPGNRGCGDLVEDWVLAIRYAETPTKGVTALRMGSSCGCGAANGASSGSNGASKGSCSCSTTSTTGNKKPRGASPECEPTAICESYSFDVYRAPADPELGNSLALDAPIVDAFNCCHQPLVDSIPTPPAPPLPANFNTADLNTKKAWNVWCCRVKQALIAHFSTGATSNCTLAEKIDKMTCPDPEGADFGTAMADAWDKITNYLAEAYLACVCASLIPPAPAGTSDDRVPLAVVSVRSRDCKVMSVCSWTPLRKQVLTFPTLNYWLGWIPLVSMFTDILGTLCCGETAAGDVVGADDAFNPAPSAKALNNAKNMFKLVVDGVKRLDGPIDSKAVIGGVYGLNTDSTTPMTAVEKANPAPFVLLNEVLRGAASAFIPADDRGGTPIPSGDTTSRIAGTSEVPIATDSVITSDTAALLDRIAVLEAAVRDLQARG